MLPTRTGEHQQFFRMDTRSSDSPGYVLCAVLLHHVLASAEAAVHINYTSARDYTVMSENYPDLYPPHEDVSWRWEVEGGKWAVQFVDFQLSCGDSEDMLIIRDGPDKVYPFSCKRSAANHHYILKSSTFSIEFSSHGSRDPEARGFKCNIFYGATTDELTMKIDATLTARKGGSGTKEGAVVSNEVVIALLVIIVILIICVIASVVTWLMFRRRRHQQMTNTSVHLNIGAIRRESAVSYTRNGTGGLPGEGRARDRLGSESSLPPEDATSPKRPVKRSGSNASWAMRAEMSTSVRNGSCSSDASTSHRTANVYTPMPGDTSDGNSLELNLDKSGYDPEKAGMLGCESYTTGSRLSTIPEEPRLSVGKGKSSHMVPMSKGKNSLAIGGAGYILMTSCSADYINFSD